MGRNNKQTTSISHLHVDDLVADERGTLGKVVSFTRDTVVIDWDDVLACHHTDADLRTRGVMLVEGAR